MVGGGGGAAEAAATTATAAAAAAVAAAAANQCSNICVFILLHVHKCESCVVRADNMRLFAYGRVCMVVCVCQWRSWLLCWVGVRLLE